MFLNKKFFIGIDQTGAVDSKGNPKPLPTSLIIKTKNNYQINTNLYIKSLDKESILQLVKSEENLSKTFILVDSVLGLPLEDTINDQIKKIFKTASDFSFNNKRFGAEVAYQFFNSLLINKKSKNYPQRKIEIITKANSIFKLKPFQRNIGCGTFRVWKDLAKNTNWYNIWPVNKLDKNKCIIAEGYPSYYWKNLVLAKRGDSKALLKFIETNLKVKVNFGDNKDFKTIDHMDSCILSLKAALASEKDFYLDESQKILKKEGWIFGVKNHFNLL
jgi:hypothetical protein